MTIESKTTRPISMILVSFFAEDNVLSDELNYAISSTVKVTKIERSALSFGTPVFFTCRQLSRMVGMVT